QNKKLSLKVFTFDQLSKTTEILDGIDVLWFHRVDTSHIPVVNKEPHILSSVKDFVRKGGNLLLTQDAFPYIVDLGLETERTQVRYVEVRDSGYGRKIGLHAFREHPVFDGLFGGANIYNPYQDIKCRQNGYFDDSVPGNGKVIAVDWSYIHLRENSKLMVEYEYGAGRVIAVGAYVYLAEPNYHTNHLTLFLENIFNYLAGQKRSEKKYYWDDQPNLIRPFKKSTPSMEIPSPKVWDKSPGSISLYSRDASEDFWDIAGQRLVLMGKERGGIEEIWAHPFMALRDYEVGIQFTSHDSILWLNDQIPELEIRPESISRQYKFRRAYLKEIVTTSITKPTGVVHYEYRGVYPAKMIVRFKSNMRLMWPYSQRVTGNLFYAWDPGLNAFIIKDENEEFGLILGSNSRPDQHIIGPFNEISKADTLLRGVEGEHFLISGALEFNLKMNDNLDMIITASNQGMVELEREYRAAVINPEAILIEARESTRDFLAEHTQVTTPDSVFNEGYKWSLIGANRFYVDTPGVGKSLVAGYSTTATGWDGGHQVNGRPGYAWYFGRDAQWSGFALLNYGDFGKVRSILKIFQDYQDLSGKIFHELSTSGVVHYDAADSTPLYIVLAGRYLKHSGDLKFLRESWPYIKKAVDFCFSTDTNRDHLIENTNVGHGWVEGGGLFGSLSTLYLSSCWAEALKEAAYIALSLGYIEKSEEYLKEYKVVKKIINEEFWDEKNKFFHHGKKSDGSFNPELTILAAIPLLFKQVDEDKTIPVLEQFGQNGFSSDWGVRIVKEESELFNPNGYHTGSVWPLYTGWTALAEYKNGNSKQGYSHIMNNLQVYRYWAKGFVEEVLNGLQYKPSGVCRHQCWSQTMVSQPILEGMLGLEPNAVEHKVSLSPSLPAHWDSFTVNHMKIGEHDLNFEMKRIGGTTTYQFSHSGRRRLFLSFEPFFPPGTKIHTVKLNGEEVKPRIDSNSRHTQLKLDLELKKSTTLKIEHFGGIDVIPLVPNPKPGYKSKGFRFLSADYRGKEFIIELQGRSGSNEVIELYLLDGEIDRIDNARLIEQKDNMLRLAVSFGQNKTKYVNKTVKVLLK
ncbi:hypothetical protein JYT44_03350, partial [Caldithrix abyssi]|nr:hypothetical protein [Caldithrix abyssi]